MPTPGMVAGVREHAAWEDPAGRVLASLRAAGVPVAERRLPAGGPIYGEGDPDGGLYFVVSGSARVYKRYGRGGLKEATVALVGAGASSASPRWRWRGHTATTPRPPPRGAASRRCARRRSRATWRVTLRAGSPSCSSTGVGRRGGRRRSRGCCPGGPPAAGQPAAGARRRAGTGGGNRGERLTQERLAEMVACCREAVSPELASLRREGVLGVGERGGIVVLDRPALTRAALPAFTQMRTQASSELRA